VFETGDPRYSWINKVQAVGKGVLSADKTRLDSTTKSTSSDKRRVSATAASLCARVSIGAINGKSARSRHDQEPNERPYKIGDLLGPAACLASRADHAPRQACLHMEATPGLPRLSQISVAVDLRSMTN
jgi:hypothetical protein